MLTLSEINELKLVKAEIAEMPACVLSTRLINAMIDTIVHLHKENLRLTKAIAAIEINIPATRPSAN